MLFVMQVVMLRLWSEPYRLDFGALIGLAGVILWSYRCENKGVAGWIRIVFTE